jgi:hypothetical protein
VAAKHRMLAVIVASCCFCYRRNKEQRAQKSLFTDNCQSPPLVSRKQKGNPIAPPTNTGKNKMRRCRKSATTPLMTPFFSPWPRAGFRVPSARYWRPKIVLYYSGHHGYCSSKNNTPPNNNRIGTRHNGAERNVCWRTPQHR